MRSRMAEVVVRTMPMSHGLIPSPKSFVAVRQGAPRVELVR